MSHPKRSLMAPKNVRKTLSLWASIRKLHFNGYPLMLVGYMRVSSDSDRQNTDLQRDALLAAGVDARHLYEDRASGAKDDRSGLSQALEFIRPGDVLVVWKLDRLGRSLSHLLAIVNTLKDKHVSFWSLTEGMTSRSSASRLPSMSTTPSASESPNCSAIACGRPTSCRSLDSKPRWPQGAT